MLISLREAADLSFQLVFAVTAVIGGMALATATAKTVQTPRPMIDVSRPVLWEAAVVRVDRQEPLVISIGQPAGNTCVDAIGLRIECDLPGARHQAS